MSKTWIVFLLVALMAGATAGVVGSITTEAYLARYTTSLEQEGTPPRLSDERTRSASNTYQESLDRVRDRVLPSVVAWHRRLPETVSVLRGSYRSSSSLGSGAIISSDGWVLTSRDVFRTSSADQMVAVVGTRVYEVIEAVEDPGTDAMLVKLDATNLFVLSFGDASALRVGEQVFVADRFDRFAPATVHQTAPEAVLATTSEDLDVLLPLALSVDSIVGAPVVNSFGDLVGYLEASGHLRPLDWVVPAIRRVLKGESIVRPRLGVDVVMLDQAVGHEAFGSGALVTSLPALGTPARLAELQTNDVILRVAGRDIGGATSIARVLLDYKPGDVVMLNVRRDGETFDVDVVLDERN